MYLNWLAKIELRRPGHLVVNIIINFYCTRVHLYAKMLKKTETEKTSSFVTFLSLGAFQLGGGWAGPLSTPLLYCITGFI